MTRTTSRALRAAASRPFDLEATRGFSAGLHGGQTGLAPSSRAAALEPANGSLSESPLGVFGWWLPARELAELAARDSR